MSLWVCKNCGEINHIGLMSLVCPKSTVGHTWEHWYPRADEVTTTVPSDSSLTPLLESNRDE